MAGFRRVGEQPLHPGARGGLIRLSRLTLEAPDGSLHERDVVHHPGAVAVVPLHADGTVTLLTQYRAALGAEVVELPAGLRDQPGEPAEDTATRELAEEAGLAAGRIEHLITFHNSPGFSDETVSVFLASGLSETPPARQGVEEQHLSVSRVGLGQALAMIEEGRITDAKTVIGLLCLDRRLARRARAR